MLIGIDNLHSYGCKPAKYEDSDEYRMLIEYRKLNADNRKRLFGYTEALLEIQN